MAGALYLLPDLLLSKKQAVAQPRLLPPPQDGAQPAFEKGVRGCAQRHSRKRGGFHTTTTITTTTIRPTYTHNYTLLCPSCKTWFRRVFPFLMTIVDSLLFSYHPMSRVFVTISFSRRVTTLRMYNILSFLWTLEIFKDISYDLQVSWY